LEEISYVWGYDKEAWEQGFKDIEKLPSGSYRVVGLRYPT